ncbi:putative holin-like toxin [Lactiplantibacillus plantarum]
MDYAGSFKGGGCLFPCEVRPMGTWNNLQEGFTVNERFQTLSLMLLFAMFILALLTYIDKRNK